jgi:NTP pyrophosphatase (non-canonical NTP hydrolase)
MANREGIDLDEAFEKMMEKVETRDEGRWTRKRGKKSGSGKRQA